MNWHSLCCSDRSVTGWMKLTLINFFPGAKFSKFLKFSKFSKWMNGQIYGLAIVFIIILQLLHPSFPMRTRKLVVSSRYSFTEIRFCWRYFLLLVLLKIKTYSVLAYWEIGNIFISCWLCWVFSIDALVR